MVENNQEYRLKYWATRSSIRSFAHTAHSFACSGLLASLAPSAALTRSLARSLRSLPCSWESDFLMSQNDLVLSHSAPPLPLPSVLRTILSANWRQLLVLLLLRMGFVVMDLVKPVLLGALINHISDRPTKNHQDDPPVDSAGFDMLVLLL